MVRYCTPIGQIRNLKVVGPIACQLELVVETIPCQMVSDVETISCQMGSAAETMPSGVSCGNSFMSNRVMQL